MAREKIFLARVIHRCPSLFPDKPYEEYRYKCIYEGVDIVCDFNDYQMMLRMNNYFIQTRSGEKLLVA
jgi:hypothetical protein